MRGDPTKPGRFYVRDARGRLHDDGPTSTTRPDVWICRRVADYPDARPPSAAAIDRCTDCDAPIAYNPARVVDAPRVCMQCAGITPEPFP
jgi:hypothetical protein